MSKPKVISGFSGPKVFSLPTPQPSTVSFFFAPLLTLKVLILAVTSCSSLQTESLCRWLSSSTRPCDSPSVVYAVADPCSGHTCRLSIALDDIRTWWVAPSHNHRLSPNPSSPSPDQGQQVTLSTDVYLIFLFG
jgi:hypothetical protein